ncbi:ornithine cyclodeaminase family protein [Oscillibacter sp. MSJ-2]|uniref:Ornithine cyclodeaminase family protein n=1 Tax=Dysosmobacter acutus TaxID=2841504 RepID=A0ABS6F5J5_9FIRM|nr:ornithine cyclodeaminase family protein [Dysosmobacter acutus]
MSEVLILSQETIGRVLTMSDAIRGVEEAYCQKSTGAGCLFPLICHVFEPERADLDIKSGHLARSGIYGLKMVSWFGDNEKKGLPALFGTTLLFDDSTGVPVALLNAGAVTGMRTGAAGAVGAKYLARRDSRRMLMVGTGAQAPYQIAAVLLAMPGIDTVELCSPRSPSRAADRLDAIRQAVEELLNGGRAEPYIIAAAENLEEAVGRSDVIVTATPSHQPLIRREWVRPGTHFSCVGADMAGKQELDGAILGDARIFVDDLTQAVSVGECEMAIRQGHLGPEEIAGEIGDLIEGALPGRTDREEVTVFDSTGIALQDLVVSKVAVERAKERRLGVTAEL